MKREEIENVVEVVNGLLHCLEIAKSPSAQKNILSAIMTTLNCLDPKDNFFKDIYESQGKIPAIREYRAHFVCGLKEAKDAIEKMASEYGWFDHNTPPRTF